MSVRLPQFQQVFAEYLAEYLGRGFELVAGHLFGHLPAVSSASSAPLTAAIFNTMYAWMLLAGTFSL